MLKKSIVLVIALMVVGLAVVPQVQAQNRTMDQISREMQPLAAKAENGTITPAEQQRLMDLSIEMMMLQGLTREQATAMLQRQLQAQGQPQSQQTNDARRTFEQGQELQRQNEQATRQGQQQYQRGNNAGWPSAQLRERGIANLQQPAGTQASYSGEGNGVETIFLTGANANTLQALKRQIEAIAGKTMEGSGNKFSVMYRETRFDRSYVDIELSGTEITIYFWVSAG